MKNKKKTKSALKSVPAAVNKPAAKEDLGQITLSYRDCASSELASAMDKLDEFTGWQDPKSIYGFNRLRAVYDSHVKQARQNYGKLVKRHTELEYVTRPGKDGKMEKVNGKDGKPLTKPKLGPNAAKGGAIDFIFKDRAKFDADYAEMEKLTFSVKVRRFSSEDLLAAGLTPKEIRACAKIDAGVDEEELAALLAHDTDVEEDDDNVVIDTDGELDGEGDAPNPEMDNAGDAG